jgi:hypothetical protein
MTDVQRLKMIFTSGPHTSMCKWQNIEDEMANLMRGGHHGRFLCMIKWVGGLPHDQKWQLCYFDCWTMANMHVHL